MQCMLCTCEHFLVHLHVYVCADTKVELHWIEKELIIIHSLKFAGVCWFYLYGSVCELNLTKS